MHDWTEIAASRQHREDLLREAAAQRLTRDLPALRPRRRVRALLYPVWWELLRDLQRVMKLLRAPR